MGLNKIIAVIIVLTLITLSCRESKIKENPAQLALRQQMLQYFTPPAVSGESFSGLWRAEQVSLEKAIENRYLQQYKAQADEASREVLRDRLKGIRTYLRIEQNRVEMLTFSAEGGVGANIGELNAKGKQGKLILRGKNNSTTTVSMDLKVISGRETIEYYEEGNMISFYREERSAEELTKEFMERMQNTLSLPEY